MPLKPLFHRNFKCLHICLDKRESYEGEHCQCGTSKEYPDAKTHCHKWFGNLAPMCILKNGSESRYCPGAFQIKGKETYFTDDESICNTSISESPQVFDMFHKSYL